MKFLISFGQDHLVDFNVNPLKVVVVIAADNENMAREKAFNFDGIGDKFCTSYPYHYLADFKSKYNVQEMTLEELDKLRL